MVRDLSSPIFLTELESEFQIRKVKEVSYKQPAQIIPSPDIE